MQGKIIIRLTGEWEALMWAAIVPEDMAAEAAVPARVPVHVPVEEEPAAREKISTEPGLKR